jgi:uracil-DNA glycosylase family 4
MRDCEPARSPVTTAPQGDIEVEHPRTPSLAASTAELAFDGLQASKHFGRVQMAFDERDGIGEVPAGATVGCIQDDRRRVEQAEVLIEPGDRGFDDALRTAVAAVWPVRSDCDGVELGHGAALSLRAKRVDRRPKVNQSNDAIGLLRLFTPRNDVQVPTPAAVSPIPEAEAPRDCPLCPRLVAFRHLQRAEHPGWWNAPVPAFGDRDAWLAIVGLAPGKRGANRTGRPFTGDYAGDLLFSTLLKFGLAEGEYLASPGDGLQLKGAVILNAVKCLPPGNKPEPSEIATCRHYLDAGLAALTSVRVVVALGQIAHTAAAKALGLAKARFAHGAEAIAPCGRILLSSYHCSRQNTNTGRLDAEMFESVFERALGLRHLP